ncbi:hypothetical protein [Prosthecobacter sp.]|uniref:hypothetical protein n=1 Tax=Prosthecobacter sp. TaxID=1965333 RepID=UPI0037850D3E
MNAITEADSMEMHYSLLDVVKMMGWSAWPVFLWTLLLLVLGAIALVKRFPPGKCWAFVIGAFVPACYGVAGTVTGAMSAFATLRSGGLSDPAKFHGALHEISLAATAGFFCSAVLMTLAIFVWLRSQSRIEQPLS